MPTVEALVAKIERDPRHTEFQIILSDHIEHRLFGKWAMAYTKLSDASLHVNAGNAYVKSTDDLMSLLKDPGHYLGDYLSGLFLQLFENQSRT